MWSIDLDGGEVMYVYVLLSPLSLSVSPGLFSLFFPSPLTSPFPYLSLSLFSLFSPSVGLPEGVPTP